MGDSSNILVQVGTEPVNNSREALEIGGIKDIIGESIVDQKCDKQNWQTRKTDSYGQVGENEQPEIFRSCANQCDVKNRMGSEIPKTMSIVGMNLMNENVGVYSSDNRFNDAYNYPVTTYANVVENNYNARYLSRNWFGHQSEQYCPLVDAHTSTTNPPERELYNMANVHSSEPGSYQTVVSKLHIYNANDGVSSSKRKIIARFEGTKRK